MSPNMEGWKRSVEAEIERVREEASGSLEPATPEIPVDAVRAGARVIARWRAEFTRQTGFERAHILDVQEAREVIEAARPLLAPQPLLNREAVKQALLAVWRREAEAETVDSPEGHCDGLADAVMVVARPMPTREQIIEAMARAEGRTIKWHSEQWRHLAEEVFGWRADAVLALINGTEAPARMLLGDSWEIADQEAVAHAPAVCGEQPYDSDVPVHGCVREPGHEPLHRDAEGREFVSRATIEEAEDIAREYGAGS